MFFGLVRAWTTDNAYGNVSTEQFVQFAEAHTGEDLRALFNAWLYEDSLPELPLAP